MSWPPNIGGITCDPDPEVYWISVKYHDLPEHLQALARSQRSALDLQIDYSNLQALVNAPAFDTYDGDASADGLGSGPQQLAPDSGTQHVEHSGTLDQPSTSRVIYDGKVEDDCRKNPNMQLFLQRHPSPTMQEKAIRRDAIARHTLGEFYQQHSQDSYDVIEKRANMTQDLNARAQELGGG